MGNSQLWTGARTQTPLSGFSSSLLPSALLNKFALVLPLFLPFPLTGWDSWPSTDQSACLEVYRLPKSRALHSLSPSPKQPKEGKMSLFGLINRGGGGILKIGPAAVGCCPWANSHRQGWVLVPSVPSWVSTVLSSQGL